MANLWWRIWNIKQSGSGITGQCLFGTICKHSRLEMVTTNADVPLKYFAPFFIRSMRLVLMAHFFDLFSRQCPHFLMAFIKVTLWKIWRTREDYLWQWPYLTASLGKRKKESSGFFCLLLWQFRAEQQQMGVLRFFFVNFSFEAMFLFVRCSSIRIILQICLNTFLFRSNNSYLKSLRLLSLIYG